MLLLLSDGASGSASWSRGDIIAVIAVAVALVGPPIAVWAVRYKLKIRLFVDTSGVLQITAKNRGRVNASVGPARLVARGNPIDRLLRFITRRGNGVIVLQDAIKNASVNLEPNEETEWYLLPEDRAYRLPQRYKPFADPIFRKPGGREAAIQVPRGARRPRFVRRKRNVTGSFSRLPTPIAQEIQGREASARASTPEPAPAPRSTDPDPLPPDQPS
jgi:hypothetical protein